MTPSNSETSTSTSDPSLDESARPVYLITKSSGVTGNEISLRKLMWLLNRFKISIGIWAFVFSIASLITVLYLPNIFKSEALLAPVTESKASRLSALAGQFGGLASLAGVSIPAGAIDETLIALEIIKSRGFIKEFINNHEILPPLIAARGWDQAANNLIYDGKVYDRTEKAWVRNVKGEPSAQEGYEAFKKILSISKANDSGLITIGIEFYSPAVAKQWVEWIVSDLNSYMRVQKLEEAEKTISYLKKQLEKTSIAGMQNVFYQLIEEETKTMMLANIREDYALKVIDPAVIPDEHVRPNRILLVVLATVVGVFFGVFFALMRSYKAKIF